MPKRALLLFTLLAIAHLAATYFNYPLGIYLTKPLLLPALAFIYYHQLQHFKGDFERWFLAGLLFSWAGDVLLMFAWDGTGTGFFMGGLASFLLAHLCYSVAFTQHPPRGIRWQPGAALLFYAIALALVWYLWPALDNVLRVAISAYALAISTMAVLAYGMFQKLTYRPATYLLLGAICFIFSDSVIALDKFQSTLSIWMPRMIIMSSYILAQLLLVNGAILASQEDRS